MGDLNTLFGALTELLLGAAGQPWIYLVVVLGGIIDGFFPPFPSEAIVVGLASLMLAPGGPEPWLLFPAAALGAFLGDNIAYSLGRRVGTRRFKWMRAPLMARSFDRVGQKLEHRAVSFILVARFLPVVRVAVNLAAGATGYSRKCFVAITAFSATVWAGYSLAIGALAGAWFQGNPMLGLVVAIAFAALLGLIADWVAGFFRRKARQGAMAQSVPEEAAAEQLISS